MLPDAVRTLRVIRHGDIPLRFDEDAIRAALEERTGQPVQFVAAGADATVVLWTPASPDDIEAQAPALKAELQRDLRMDGRYITSINTADVGTPYMNEWQLSMIIDHIMKTVPKDGAPGIATCALYQPVGDPVA